MPLDHAQVVPSRLIIALHLLNTLEVQGFVLSFRFSEPMPHLY
jgi:hypothetical protein